MLQMIGLKSTLRNKNYSNMNLKIINWRLDLNIALNHLLFRAKLSDLNDEKKKVILTDAEAINNALGLINELQVELDKEYQRNSRLHVLNLELREMLFDLQEKEVEIWLKLVATSQVLVLLTKH